jgi:hypothetical protein
MKRLLTLLFLCLSTMVTAQGKDENTTGEWHMKLKKVSTYKGDVAFHGSWDTCTAFIRLDTDKVIINENGRTMVYQCGDELAPSTVPGIVSLGWYTLDKYGRDGTFTMLRVEATEDLYFILLHKGYNESIQYKISVAAFNKGREKYRD